MPRVRHTRADYDRLPEGAYAQLIEGELVMTPAPTPWHERLGLRLIGMLADLLGPAWNDRVLGSRFEIIVGERPDEEIVQPDVVVFPEGTRATGRQWKPPTPVLVAEILSPSTRRYDRGAKLRIYATAGVKEAWLLDPVAETIEIHDLVATTTRLFASGEVAESRAVAGLRVDVAVFFAV
ncbi:MAG: Uma2 family endonuclease [Planctomycetota bacterium]